MNHLPPLITDLALILAAAAVITLLFRKLKQPLVLGYIIAGILVSPNFTLFPTILEVHNVQVWAEIGVIFLLFSLGLEFSFKKLVHVGGSSSVAAVTEAIGMSVIGYATGQLLGWTSMDSIFLGALLAVSSTTIIIKAIDELNLKKKKFATLVFGILIVEDIIAIALLVLLATFTTTKQFISLATLMSILKLVFFLVLWFITGIFFIPSLLKKARNLLNDEILLIVSIAMCLLMVYLATKSGFSAALGAFVMGSLLAETTKAETIENLVKPVKDLFGAIFFVSVGMLIDLEMTVDYIGPILLITSVCILGKILTTGFGAFISGNTLKVSIQTGMSLAQIGEFSFIIAALGNSLKVTSDFLYPTIVAVSGITTFTTPYFIKFSTPFYEWINSKLPERWRNSLAKYGSEALRISSFSDWEKVLRTFIINLGLFSVILTAIIYLSSNYVLPWVRAYLDDSFGPIAASAITLLLMAPFLWGLTVRNEQTESFARIFAQQRYKGPIWLMRGIKISLALFFIIFLLNRFFSFAIAIYAAVLMATIFSILRNRIQALYDALERRFIRNLNDKELQAELKAMEMQTGKRNAALAPWDAHLTTFEILPESPVIGKTLGELKWREQIGINVALIKRGRLTITIPQKNEYVYPGDKLYIICTDAQEKKMNAILRPDKKLLESQKDIQVELEKFIIRHNSPFVNKTISESGIRRNATALVVGIERNGNRILNPDSTTVLEAGDLVWIVEEKS